MIFRIGTLHINPVRFLPTIIVVMAVLIAFELWFRTLPQFNSFGGWGNIQLQKKLESIEKFHKTRGRLDLMTLSSSIGRPWDVHQWEEACGGKIACFNGAFPNQRPQQQRFLFEDYFWPRYHPTHLVYGIVPGDLNSSVGGKLPDRPRDPSQSGFWDYRAVRKLTAHSTAKKVSVGLEEISHLFGSRRQVRTWLRWGLAPEQQPEPTIGSGVVLPAPRRIPTGPLTLPWQRLPEMLKMNPYHRYWVPPDGELGELVALDRFCKQNGVKFTVVEVPPSPIARLNYDRPVEDHALFLEALEQIQSQGVTVLPMARDLNLDNSYFEDTEHLNRFGGQVITEYVYENVIRKWFPDKALVEKLPPVERIDLFENVSARDGLTTRAVFGIHADAQYAASHQVLVSKSGTTVLVKNEVSPGSWLFELYAGDGSTTSPEHTGEARVVFRLSPAGSDNQLTSRIPLLRWENTRLGISYTHYHFTTATSASLSLEVEKIGTRPLILDSVFLRRKVSPTPDGVRIE